MGVFSVKKQSEQQNDAINTDFEFARASLVL